MDRNEGNRFHGRLPARYCRHWLARSAFTCMADAALCCTCANPGRIAWPRACRTWRLFLLRCCSLLVLVFPSSSCRLLLCVLILLCGGARAGAALHKAME